MSAPLLEARSLTRHFGGLRALNAVSLECEMGQVHAVIGPNGAGKSTLVNVLSGELPASGGQVLFDGRVISGLAADRVSRLGIARSYQNTNLFLPFTAFENCRLAAQSRLPGSRHFWRPARACESVNAQARRALDAVGLGERAALPAAALSHGERRQVEIAMALAMCPRVLLLDEPLAGMGLEDSARIVALLRSIARGHALLLIEHDMDAVFAIADLVTVMVDGRVLACAPPAEIRSNRAVQEAYLGVGEAQQA